MVHKYQNAVQVYLWAPLLSSAGSVVLETGKGGLLGSDFPLVGKITKYDTDRVTVLKREIVNITNRSWDIANITRAYESCPLGTASSALQQVTQNFDTNDILEIVVSKKCLDDFNTDIADLQTFRDTTVPATYATKTELANSQLVYGASSAGTDAYAITVANVSAYQNGQRFSFLADVGNTWPATFKVNALSALTIKKNNDQDLATWDIEAGQIVEVVINNTDGVAEMVSQVATVVDLSWYDTKTQTITAWESLFQGDVVYPSGNDIMERVRPIGFASNTATFTEATGGTISKVLKIDATRQLHMNGGYMGTALGFSAKIWEINAWETDCTYWSAYTAGGINIQTFDVCQIDTYKFLVFFKDHAAWYKAVILDVDSSGNTITNGSIVTIETSWNGAQIACANLDTSRTAILYTKDSDTKWYVQILSTSGDTISTNTAVEFDSNTNANTGRRCVMAKLDTNKLIAVYNRDSSDFLDAKIIDVTGTVPTVNAYQALVNTNDQYSIAKLAVLSTTKVALMYWDGGAGNNYTYICILTISGSTVTKWSNLTLYSTQNAIEEGYAVVIPISPSVLLTTVKENATTMRVHLLYVDGTTITSTATQEITTSSLTYKWSWACKLKPFKYLVCSGEQYCFVTLSDNVAKKVGVMQADVADTASGSMFFRYKLTNIFSWLTAWTSMYIDDSWRASTESSSLSTRLWNAMNSTTILLE